MSRKLYIYSTKTYYEDKISHGEVPFLKIGETEQETVEQRVNQQDTTSTAEPLEIKYERVLPDNVRDTDIHEFLRAKGKVKTRSDKNREWFIILLDEAIMLINEYITGSHRINNYFMRIEQKDAHDKIVNYFNSNKNSLHNDFLFAAKMRFGKNFTLLNVAKTLNSRNVLVLTYKPWVFDSLEYDILNHVDFEDFKFIRFIDDRKLSRYDADKTNVIVLSAQLGIRETTNRKGEPLSINEDEGNMNLLRIVEENMTILNDYHYDLIIVDEYHYGASTEKFKSLLNKLSYKNLIYVSGTAMRDINSHRFADEQIYNWTYIDEQKKKGNDMPKMRMFALSLNEELVNEIKANFETAEYPKMAKLFEVDEQGEFIHYNHVNSFLKQIMGVGMDNNYASPFTIDDIQTPRHIFCLMPNNVKSIEAMSRLIREEYEDFHVILASGNDGIKTQKELIDNINRANLEKKSSITLSCVRFREGVTVPEWDSVLMLDDGESAVSYFQAIFRCQSKYPEKSSRKNECYVFDYSPLRMLRMSYLMTEVQSLITGRNHKEVVQEFLECAPMVMRGMKNELITVNFRNLVNAFFFKNRIMDKGFRSFEYDRNFNERVISQIGDSFSGKLPKIKSGRPTAAESIIDNGLLGGKNKIKKTKGKVRSKCDEDTGGELKDTTSVIESLKYITGKLPEYMFNTKEDEFNLDDIVATNSEESVRFFRDLCKARFDDFKELIIEGIYEPRFINQLISNYKTEEDEFWKDKSIEAYKLMFRKYFTDDEEDIKTPVELAKEIIDKLDDLTWTNPKLTICDFACKDASFLIVVKYKLMEGLKDVFPEESEREEHIVKNMLYAYCRTMTQKNFVSRVLWNKGELNNIIYCKEDILSYIKNTTMKFDAIVMNPPYQDTTHLKFLRSALDKARHYVLSVQPCNWLMKQVDSKSRGGKNEDAIVSEVENLGANIYFIDGAQYFSAGLLAELSINFIDKRKKTDIIVHGDLSGSISMYSKVSEISKYGYDPLILEFKKKVSDFLSDGNESIYDRLKATRRMKNHCSDNTLIENAPKKSWICVNFSAIRGHVNQKTGKKESDFYTLIPKDRKVEKYSEDLALYVPFEVKDKSIAEDFIEYLKSDFVRFVLFLYKNDANVVHTLKYIPYLTIRDDESLMDKFGISVEIQNRFREFIPDYYELRKQNR